MKKAFLLLLSLSIFLFSLVINCNAEGEKTYISPYFNFSINYPLSWNVNEISGLVFFVSLRENKADDFSENVNVMVEDLSRYPMSLNEYDRISLENAPKLIKNFRLLEKGRTKIDNKEASFLIYTGSSDVIRNLKFKAYTFIVGSKAYTVTYTALEKDYDKYLPQAENIMKSIKIKNK